MHYIDVDMQTDNWINEPVVIQNDSVTFVIRVTNDGEPYNLDWAATHTLVTKVKSNVPSAMSLGTVTADNELTVNLGSSEVKHVGKARSMIQLYGNDGRVSSLEFTFVVKEDIGEGYEPSENDKTLIELVLGDGPRILNEAEQATIYANEQGDYAKIEADKLDLLNQEVSGNEEERIDNESNRESAESTRVTNEDARITAENSRESAESTRELQEAQRQTNTAQAITETLDAAEIARNSQGPQGERGPQGEVGPQGPQGEPGKDGTGAGTVTAVNNIEPDETGNVEIEIPDPDLSGLATEQELQDVDNKVVAHLAEDATILKKGHVQLSNAVTSVDETKAATPKAVKTAMDRADAAFTSASNGKQVVGDAITGVDDSVVIPTDPTFQQIADAIGSISIGKKWASGSISSMGSQRSLTSSQGSNSSTPYISFDMSSLPFIPNYIVFLGQTSVPVWTRENTYYGNESNYGNSFSGGNRAFRIPYDNGELSIAAHTVNASYVWYAFE